MPTYMWRGDDPYHPENVGVRTAMELGQPVIWFLGMGGKPPLYLPIAPMLVVDEDRKAKCFYLAPVDDFDSIRALESSTVEGALKRYVIRQTKARVHQPAFRASVLAAYENRCAVCSLAHPSLLDAAHIVADREEKGIASVVNGLAMCKIHHAAFDSNFLGVRPDYVIEIRSDILREVDGPMLRHGLQDLHGHDLMCIPRNRRDRPLPELLEHKFAEFRSA
ncbi:HNH endonuclease [Brevibacterium casei]|nr:HNH endonuclease [Brevibacterium casei]QPR45714.1 HNH endonuclease [Brevibacterium casei]